MLNEIIIYVGKIFYGSGVGTRFPLLQYIYRKLYKYSSSEKTFDIDIPLNLTLSMPANDGGPTFEIAATGKFEPIETQLFIENVKPGDIIFDVGAHVGYYTLLSSKLVGKRGKVFSFEPVPENLAFLQRNIVENNLSNCIVIKKAVSEKEGSEKLYVSRTSSGDHSLKKIIDAKIIQVKTISIDKFIKRVKQFPNILKIDVEGAESLIFDGMTQGIKDTRLMLIFMEINSKCNSKEKIIENLKKSGFYIKIIDERGKKVSDYTKNMLDTLLSRYGMVNIIAQRKSILLK